MKQKRNLNENDVVLIVDDAAPRNCWSLGRVIRPKLSGDGLVRSAEILSRGKMITRPVSKLVLLVESSE